MCFDNGIIDVNNDVFGSILTGRIDRVRRLQMTAFLSLCEGSGVSSLCCNLPSPLLLHDSSNTLLRAYTKQQSSLHVKDTE